MHHVPGLLFSAIMFGYRTDPKDKVEIGSAYYFTILNTRYFLNSIVITNKFNTFVFAFIYLFNNVVLRLTTVQCFKRNYATGKDPQDWVQLFNIIC